MVEHAVIVERVERTYVSRGRVVEAVKDATFRVATGSFAALYGPSGSGKSTILNIIAGFDRPTRGRVVVFGVELGSLSWRGLVRLRRQLIGYAMQANLVLPRPTAYYNIALPLLIRGLDESEIDDRVRRAARDLRIDHVLDRPAYTLSGGELRRLVVARALVVRPKLLLLDEPTSNLDSETAELVWETVKRWARNAGSTIIAATHDTTAQKYASKIIHARDGIIRSDMQAPHNVGT